MRLGTHRDGEVLTTDCLTSRTIERTLIITEISMTLYTSHESRCDIRKTGRSERKKEWKKTRRLRLKEREKESVLIGALSPVNHKGLY